MIINFISQSNSLINVKFSTLQTDPDCSLVSKLCKVLADHPTLVQLTFGNQRTLSKKRLLQVHPKRFPICSHAFVHLARFLDVEHLTELHLSDYSQTFEDCAQCGGSGELARECLCELISKSPKLKSLNLRKCCLPEEFMKTVMRMLEPKGLKCATMFGNSGSYLADNIQAWSLDEKRPSITLDRIKLKKNKKSQVKIQIDYHGKGTMVESLNQVVKAVEDSALTLHELTVSLTRGLAKTIYQIILQNCKTLCTLELWGIDDREQEDVLQILHLLRGNSTLRELSIFGLVVNNRIITKALCEMIEHNETIHTLTISPNIIYGNYKTLARALLQNTTLQNLYVSHGVDSLKEAIRQLKVDENVPVHPNWNLEIDCKKRNH